MLSVIVAGGVQYTTAVILPHALQIHLQAAGSFSKHAISPGVDCIVREEARYQSVSFVVAKSVFGMRQLLTLVILEIGSIQSRARRDIVKDG